MPLDLAELARTEHERATRPLEAPIPAVDPSAVVARIMLRGSPQAWQRPAVVGFKISKGEIAEVVERILRGAPLSATLEEWAEDHNRKVRTITPSETIDAEKLIAAYLRLDLDERHPNGYEPDAGSAFGVRYRFFLDNYIRKDLDNLIACVMEAGSGVVYADDAQIVQGAEEKILHDPDPRTEVLFYRVGVFR